MKNYYKKIKMVLGFLVDKFGQYKPVLFISLALNAIFHHSLILIPQMETPGAVPSAYVMRHPESGKVDVGIKIKYYLKLVWLSC